ncbi:type II toxin-antitoxin system VapC family toxin [Sphingobium aromaticiconvertens]|uniref:type II toxin-antitoxin system VapC family toxin n=1 Tax=Sphingobium aromaticiconvertens TaxID=365341 RepID=UPI0030169899
MKLLLDTHLLLWAAEGAMKLPTRAKDMMEDKENTLYFSPASLWEVAIKSGLGREDFDVDTRLLRRGLLDNGYHELPINSEHAVIVSSLPSLHKDPFDRMLIAQSQAEGIALVTADATIAQYPGSIIKV